MLDMRVNRGGYISRGTLFWIVFIVAVIYLGVKFIPPYFSYYVFKGEVAGAADTAHVNSDQVIVKNLLEEARDWGLPIKQEDIIVERGDSEIRVSIVYKVDVNFFNRYTKSLYFDIYSVKPIKTK